MSWEILHGVAILLFGVLGAVWGCFLGCAVYRLKVGLPLRQPPSHCPACGHVLHWFELIPVVSYLVQRAQCRKCGAAMSTHYVLIESSCAFGAAVLAWAVFPNMQALLALFVAYCAVWFVGVTLFSKS